MNRERDYLSLILLGGYFRLDEAILSYIKRGVENSSYSLKSIEFQDTFEPDSIERESRVLVVGTKRDIAKISKEGVFENSFGFEVALVALDREALEGDFKLPFENGFKMEFFLFLERESDRDEILEALNAFNTLDSLPLLPKLIKIRVNMRRGEVELESLLRDFDLKILKSSSLERSLINYLGAVGKKITFAESCTGGALASSFIAHSGASNIIEGTFVTYSNEIKSQFLGVREETLERFGAVSRECVLEMARGAKDRVGADISVAISGIAGPSGAVDGKPVGRVFIAVDSNGREAVEMLSLKGDRVYIQNMSVIWAIFLIISNEEKFFDFFAKNS